MILSRWMPMLDLITHLACQPVWRLAHPVFWLELACADGCMDLGWSGLVLVVASESFLCWDRPLSGAEANLAQDGSSSVHLCVVL